MVFIYRTIQEILKDEEEIQSQRITIIVLAVLMVIFFGIIFGLSYWVADLHQQTVVASNGAMVTKDYNRPVAVTSMDYGVAGTKMVATKASASSSKRRRRGRQLETDEETTDTAITETDGGDTVNETVVEVDGDSELLEIAESLIDIPLGILPYLDQEYITNLKTVVLQDRYGWTRTVSVSNIVMMSNSSMILSSLDGSYVLIQDSLAAYAYFAFDQHHIRFCAACSNCASLSVLETPDMEELLSDYEDEILDRGGCSTFTDYIQHAQEGHNFTDPYLTYSENKDVSIPVYFPRKVQQIHLTNTRHYCTCINRLISASLATFPM